MKKEKMFVILGVFCVVIAISSCIVYGIHRDKIKKKIENQLSLEITEQPGESMETDKERAESFNADAKVNSDYISGEEPAGDLNIDGLSDKANSVAYDIYVKNGYVKYDLVDISQDEEGVTIYYTINFDNDQWFLYEEVKSGDVYAFQNGGEKIVKEES